MADLLHFRVWCEVDLKYETEWSETAPTVCPINPAHAITTSKTTSKKPKKGRHYEHFKSESRSTTTSTTWQTKLAFTPVIEGGRARIHWCCASDNNKTLGFVRLYNVTAGTIVGGNKREYKYAYSDVRDTQSGFAEVDFFGTTQDFEIQWKSNGSGWLQGIEDVHVEVEGV